MNDVPEHLPDHPHVRTILRYYEGCNRADAALVGSTLAEDVVHYWVDHRPVEGAESLSVFAAKVAKRTRATWSADHVLVGEDEAVVEWSMRWTPIGGAVEEILRGTEWIRFANGLISEVRSYHNNHHLSDPGNFELQGFPYGERGYSAFLRY